MSAQPQTRTRPSQEEDRVPTRGVGLVVAAAVAVAVAAIAVAGTWSLFHGASGAERAPGVATPGLVAGVIQAPYDPAPYRPPAAPDLDAGGFAWSDRAARRVRIPLADAIDLVVERRSR